MLFCVACLPAARAASDLQLAQATPAQPAAPVGSAQPAADPSQPAAAHTDEPAGNVATLQSTATVTRNGQTGPLKIQDEVFKGDVLQTGKNSALGITFTDDTTLNLSASSRIVIDEFVYQEGAKDNAAVINVTRGTMAFAAAAVAKTGDMKIETPTATLGIRGTTGVVEVPEGAAAANANNVGVKLYPDADGRVGRIDVRGRDGASLGMLTQAASGFTVRGMMVPGFGMRMSAMPMVMSAQMIERDRGFTQRVFAMQGIGRRIVMQQRTFRMQNPNRPPAFGRGPQQRGGFNQPDQQRGQQPGLRNQPGQRGSLQPGMNRPGRSGTPNQFGVQPGVQPGMQQRIPGQSGVPRQTGMPGSSPGGFQRPSGIPAIQGGAGGIINRLRVPNVPGVAGRAGVPQVPNQRMPSGVPRAGQPALPAVQKKHPQVPKQKQQPKDIR